MIMVCDAQEEYTRMANASDAARGMCVVLFTKSQKRSEKDFSGKNGGI